MKLISISGLDGSGKSTQIKMLESYFKSQGKKVFYFHAIQFGLANKISGKNNNNSKSVQKANWFQIQLRKIFLKIDICRFKKLYKKLEREDYNYILSDHYFYDSVVNIEYLKNMCHPEFISGSNNIVIPAKAGIQSDLLDSGSEAGMTKGQVRYDKNIIKSDIAIYLQTSPEIIMQRARKPDQGIEYLQTKKILYDKMAFVWNLKIIDGNGLQEEIFAKLKELV